MRVDSSEYFIPSNNHRDPLELNTERERLAIPDMEQYKRRRSTHHMHAHNIFINTADHIN